MRGHAREVATRLSAEIEALGPLRLITRGDQLAVFTFDVSVGIREGGWQLPAYTFPEHRTDLAALPVVVRRGCTHDTADLLLRDLKRLLPRLEKQPAPVHDGTGATGFHH